LLQIAQNVPRPALQGRRDVLGEKSPKIYPAQLCQGDQIFFSKIAQNLPHLTLPGRADVLGEKSRPK
jgi:hypothetical protein